MDTAGSVRAPVVAGTFYPGSARQLAADVDAMLAESAVPGPAHGAAVVRGVITPHAGYIYSGPIAATAYTFLSTVAQPPSRVVVIGPSHFEPLRGLAATGFRAWRTPLGDAVIDESARDAIVAAGARIDDIVHRSEHSIEVQLPFIQRCLPGVPVLPVAVGTGTPEASAQILARILTQDALLVVSTDLSHYHDAAPARRLDARTASAVESLDLESLPADDACGVDALRVGLAWAQHSGYRIQLLDLRNSADTAGDASRVVGYGAFAVSAVLGPSDDERGRAEIQKIR